MLENADESPASGARFVGLPADQNLCRQKTTRRFYTDFDFAQSPKTLCKPERLLKNKLHANQNAKLNRLL